MRKNDDGVKKNSLIFVSLVLVTVTALFFFETGILQNARDLIPLAYARIPKLITHWGLYLFYAVFAGLLTFALVRKNRQLKNLCLAYLKAQLVVSLAVVRVLKIAVGRARPGKSPAFDFFSLNFSHNSFPSGHATDAFVSGMFLYYLLKHSGYSGCRFLPLLYAFLIAASRVFVGAHYPSDVAAGMGIGIMGAWWFSSRLPPRSQQV